MEHETTPTAMATGTPTYPRRGWTPLAAHRGPSISVRLPRPIHRAMVGLIIAWVTLAFSAGDAFAATTGASGSSAGTAPGLSVFSGLTGWIGQYGWAGLPLAISLGGLLMTVEHHQQRTGNAVRAKGYIFSGAAGFMVISLATAGASAFKHLVG